MTSDSKSEDSGFDPHPACHKGDKVGKLGGGFTSLQPKYLRAANDFYPTPKEAADVLLNRVKFEGKIWECACGDGALSKYMEDKGYTVQSSDLRTENIYGTGGVDFLKSETQFDNIVTNPPFCLAEEFIYHSIGLSRKKSVFLLRLAFLESEKRFKLFSKHPPSEVIVISKRIPFFVSGKWHKAGSTFPHAWFIWDKEHKGNTSLSWGTF